MAGWALCLLHRHRGLPVCAAARRSFPARLPAGQCFCLSAETFAQPSARRRFADGRRKSERGDLPEGCTALTPVLWDQLVKTKKFEVVLVDAATLRSRTGQANWTGTETLPADFLAFLRREYGCDGVLFVELTTYRAYAPLAVGWRMKLVDARSGQIAWAADELFDAARPACSAPRRSLPNPASSCRFCRKRTGWPSIRPASLAAIPPPPCWTRCRTGEINKLRLK